MRTEFLRINEEIHTNRSWQLRILRYHRRYVPDTNSIYPTLDLPKIVTRSCSAVKSTDRHLFLVPLSQTKATHQDDSGRSEGEVNHVDGPVHQPRMTNSFQ